MVIPCFQVNHIAISVETIALQHFPGIRIFYLGQ